MLVKIEEIQEPGLKRSEPIKPEVLSAALADSEGFALVSASPLQASFKKVSGRVFVQGHFSAELTAPCKRCTADVPADGTWHEVTVAVDPVLFQQVGDRPVDGVAIQIEAPPGFHATLDLDDVRLMEWRPAPPTPLPIWSEIDALRAATPGETTVPTATCSSD